MPLPDTVDPAVVAFYDELLKEGELSADETKLLEGILSKDKNWKKFKSGVHARSLTDRERQELANEKKRVMDDYNKKVSDLNTLQQTLSATSSTDKTKISTLEAAIRQQQDRLHKVRQEAQKYADGDEFLKIVGLDDERAIYTLPSPSSTPSPKQGEKETPSLSKEEILNGIRAEMTQNSRELAKFQFDLLSMRDEYESLTGKKLDLNQFYNTLNQKIDQYKGDYNEVYLQEYDIVNLRNKKSEEAIQARIDKAVEEKLQQERAKLLIPSEQASALQSDFYKSIESTVPEAEKKAQEMGNPLGVENRGTVISDAVQHFQNLRQKKEQAQTGI